MTAPSVPAGDVAKLVERAQSRADASFWPDGRPHHFNYTTQDADLDRALATAFEALSREVAELRAALEAEREACAQAVEKRAVELGRQECCGIGISSGYSAPECCADPNFMISDREAAAAIRARTILATPTASDPAREGR